MDSIGTLEKLGQGRFLEDLCEDLIQVSEEVLRTGKAGKVTVNLKVSKLKNFDLAVGIEEEITRSMPKVDPKGAVVFVYEGEMHTRDPRQTVLAFRSLEDEEPEVRTPQDAEQTVRKGDKP